MTFRAPLHVAALGAASLVLALQAGAQAPTTGALRVRVTDPAGAPVSDATVTLVRGMKEVIAQGTTGADGVRLLTAPLSSEEVQLVVRRIGFARADQFLVRLAADTLPVAVTLTPSVTSLEAVKVVDRQSIRRRRLSIDADAIAASRAPLASALDVVESLRPVMIYGLVGDGMFCAGLQHVWVNGRNIRLVSPNEAVAVRQGQVDAMRRVSPRLRRYGRNSLSVDVQSVLASIRPEHIATLQGTDCNDPVVRNDRSRAAVFVTLKPGVQFSERRGSYVLGTEVGRSKVLVDRAVADATAPAPGPALAVTPGTPAPDPSAPGAIALPMVAAERLPAHRLRLLGVFDEETGAPLPGVVVVDVKSGARTVTSGTGTAMLAHLPEGGGAVRLERDGYVARELTVTIAPADTVPVTALLARTAPRR
jgi:hypothetical protein